MSVITVNKSFPVNIKTSRRRFFSDRVVVTTGNGYGSTNTKIRRFTTILVNTGNSLTYADSATLGGSITVNTPGLYCVRVMDRHFGVVTAFGASVNSSQLTTSIDSISALDRLFSILRGSNNNPQVGMTVAYFNSGDVIRHHSDGISTNTTLWAHLEVCRLRE